MLAIAIAKKLVSKLVSHARIKHSDAKIHFVRVASSNESVLSNRANGGRFTS